MNTNPFGTGGQPRPHDRRDYKITSLKGSTTPYPDTYSSLVPTIYNQGKYGTCGAHAGSMLANILFNATTSPKFLWKIIKTIDNFGLNDGTDMGSIMKALQTVGVCDLNLLDNSLGGSIEQYSDPIEINATMRQNASLKRISTYAFTNNPTASQIKQVIYDHKAVILLVDCGTGWWIPSWVDKDVNPLHVGNFVDHHFICCTKYDVAIFDGPNSWSYAWGKNGMYDFDMTYIPHILEMGVASISNHYLFNNNMYFGMVNNADVHALQIRLGILPATGNFGPKTLATVVQYQKDHNIFPAVGFVGSLTRASLNSGV